MSRLIPRLFASGHIQIGGLHMPLQVVTAADRISRVIKCDDPEQLREALSATDLQVTVRRAIERKLARVNKDEK